MMAFYRDVLGLKVRKDERAGRNSTPTAASSPCTTAPPGRPAPPKIGFWAKDIAAARQELVGRGAKSPS